LARLAETVDTGNTNLHDAWYMSSPVSRPLYIRQHRILLLSGSDYWYFAGGETPFRVVLRGRDPSILIVRNENNPIAVRKS
jgi:hypothetical protein